MTATPFTLSATLPLTLLALLAFAANSLLCRLALLAAPEAIASIDPILFTLVRLGSGALTLWALLALRQYSLARKKVQRQASNGDVSPTPSSVKGMMSGFSLFLYALCFSFAYVQLDTGTGALILFGAVQVTLIVVAIIQGQRLSLGEWIGLVMAFCGLLYLMWPSLSSPTFSGFVLMLTAGIAWGAYTLIGVGSRDGLGDTTRSFILSLPWIAIATVGWWLLDGDVTLSMRGVIYGLLSGVFASGIGYAIWYSALTGLTTVQASVSMLTVPLIAAALGVWLLDEALTMRFVLASAAILLGVLCVVLSRQPSKTRSSKTKPAHEKRTV